MKDLGYFFSKTAVLEKKAPQPLVIFMYMEKKQY